MRITFDRKADAVYIYLKGTIGPGEAKKTYPCDPLEVNGMINLDFDKEGKLIGIEVMDASKKLPQEFLKTAEIIDE